MKRPPIKLRAKITFAVALAVIVSAVTISAVAYVSAYQTERRLFADASLQQSYDDAGAAKSLMATRPTSEALPAIRKYLDDHAFGNVYDPAAPEQCSGATQDDTPCFSELPADVRAAVQAPHAFSIFNDSAFFGSTSYIIVSPLIVPNHPPLALVEINSFSSQQQALDSLQNRLLLLNAAAVLLAIIVGFGVATGLRRPVRRVGVAAQRFGEGNLDVRSAVRGHDELAELGINFNAMADRLSTTLRDLQESQSLQHRFVADVSHELRTPLSAMVAAGEGLDSGDPVARTRSADLLREQTRRMARMVDDLLEMSRFDAGQSTLELEPTDILDLARDAARTVAPDATIDVHGIGDTNADIDVRRVHAIIRNLTANAVHHGAPPVDVEVDGTGTDITVTVTDHGRGIPPELSDTVFDRFVRADSARTTTSSSTGLGLAIARENARLHGGDITLAPEQPTTFSIRLPRTTLHR